MELTGEERMRIDAKCHKVRDIIKWWEMGKYPTDEAIKEMKELIQMMRDKDSTIIEC